MKASNLLIFVFVHLLFRLSSQNAQEDFAKVNSNYMEAKNILIEMEYRVFENHFSKAPLEVSTGYTKQKGNNIYQNIASTRSLMNEKITIHMDTNDHVLIIADPVKIEEQKKEALKFDIKGTLAKCRNITYKEINKLIGMYSLEFKDNVITEYDRCDVYIDRKTFLLTKIVYYYNEEMALKEDAPEEKKEQPRLEITFKKVDVNAKLKDSDFDERLFIQREGTKILAANAYKGYKIVDTRYSGKRTK